VAVKKSELIKEINQIKKEANFKILNDKMGKKREIKRKT